MSVLESAKQEMTTPENPHRGLHKVIFFFTSICLTAQVIEGTLIIPLVLVYFGYPQVGIKEMCDEMYNIVYEADDRECIYPYPLFSLEPEPWLQESKEHIYGHVTPPRPNYKLPKWREMIDIVDESKQRKQHDESNASIAPSINSSIINVEVSSYE